MNVISLYSGMSHTPKDTQIIIRINGLRKIWIGPNGGIFSVKLVAGTEPSEFMHGLFLDIQLN